MKVVITDDALNDLEQIGDHIARDHPERARSFVAELVAEAQNLAEMPERFPLVPRYADRGIPSACTVLTSSSTVSRKRE
jgi:toxin ParE1/3/4